MNIAELKLRLLPAIKHIEILCKGFSIVLERPYKDVLNKVCEKIENGFKSQIEFKDQLLFILKRYDNKKTTAYPSENAVQQFKEKFIRIAKTEMIPVIKLFCKKNPEVNLNDFRPLFEIRIKVE